MVHVQYFGDKGRHSWVSANCMIEFTDLADFLKLSESLTPEMKKKDVKYATAFIVKQGIKLKWDNAVEEATAVKHMTNEQRAETFVPKRKVSRFRETKTSSADEKPKRKYSNEHDGSDTKRAKYDNVISKLIHIESLIFMYDLCMQCNVNVISVPLITGTRKCGKIGYYKAP